MFVYNAELYCDACGRDLVARLKREGEADEGDSDGFPQSVRNGSETDSPDHCASGETCLEPLDLREWGLDPAAPLYGAETPVIGSLLDQKLTERGVAYLREMLKDDCEFERLDIHEWRCVAHAVVCVQSHEPVMCPKGYEAQLTPYQQALHRFWWAAYADELS